MKRYHIFLLMQLLGLLSVCPVVLSSPVAQPDEGNALVSSVMSERATVVCRTGEPVDVRLGCFSLSADSGSLLHDMDMHATVLPLGECAALRSEMNNVTAGGEGVRLLPNGTHFSENSPARITLAYDPQRIPDNYRAEDIYTFCCEQTGEQWYRLERIGIDTVAHTVTSLSTHFTDFANAIISLPELPESSAYVPTTLSDLPDPDPLQGIPMVQVNGLNSFGSPTGDNSGNASLTYPIVIPAGRHGLQPDVNLYYNSANGNGPLGVGWSIPMPAVTIDTRWGVPRYDAVFETEAYLVNGEPIVRHGLNDDAIPLPHQDSVFHRRTEQTERFWFRDTRNATRVIRHGRFPNEYWWEVTTTTGITYYYGRNYIPSDPIYISIDENSVLRDDKGNIGYWALTAVVDLYGNYMFYRNSLQNAPNGKNIRVDSILYTGNVEREKEPKYKIEMNWAERCDEISDGRLGLLRLIDKRLCNIIILYKDTIISRYDMHYDDCSTNNIWKSRLSHIYKSDMPHTNHSCGYIEDYISTHNEYAGSRTSFTYNDAPQSVFGPQTAMWNSDSYISKSQSGSWNIGGTATVGVGIEVFKTDFSAGGHYNFNQNFNRIESMLLDLNGDGLPDIVYKEGNEVKYRPQLPSATGFGNAETVQGLSRLSRDVSRTHNWGLQLSFGADLSFANPITLAYTDYYFSDINADGLPDMVTPDGILFNHLTAQGHPSFTPFTGSTLVHQNNSACQNSGIHYTGTIDERLECEVREVAVDSISINGHDNGWHEPNDFQTSFWPETGELSSNDWDPLSTGGGIIRGSLQDYTAENESEESHDQQALEKRPSVDSVSSINTSQLSNPTREGFYEDGYTYRVERGKIIKYGIETICHEEHTDPAIETVRVWVVPENGYIDSITYSIRLKPDTSFSRSQSRKADGVKYIIQLNKNNQVDTVHFISTSVYIKKNESIAATDNSLHTDKVSIGEVSRGDVILFRLKSGDNSLYDDVDWTFNIAYRKNGITYFYNSESSYICTGNRPFVAPSAGQAIIRYKWRNDYTSSIYDASLRFTGSSKPAVSLAHNDSSSGNYIPFDTIQMSQGDIIRPIVSYPNTAANLWSDMHITPQIEFMGSFSTNSTNTTYVADTSIWYPDMPYPCTTLSIDSAYSILFGPLFQCFGRFAYNDLNGSDTLNLCSLVNTERQAKVQATIHGNTTWQNMQITDPVDIKYLLPYDMTDSYFTPNHLFNPLDESSTWVPVYPDSRTERWIPYGNMGYICRSGQSNSRNMEKIPQQDLAEQQMADIGIDMDEDIPYYDSAIPLSNGSSNGRDKTVRKSTKSNQFCFSGGALFLTESHSSGTYSVITDYIDLNGDGFPDAVGPSGVQYSLPWGGLGKLVPAGIDAHLSNNESTGLNLSATVALIKKLAGNSVSKCPSAINGSGTGGSHNEGGDNTDHTFIDMNGDGLPDIVYSVNHKVRYNLGYRFTGLFDLPNTVNFINNSISNSSGASGTAEWMQEVSKEPFAISQYSISGGVDVSISQNRTTAQLMDINGDGLPDLVKRQNNGVIQVAYNKGSSFTGYTSLAMNTPLQKSLTWNLGATISGTLGVSFAGAWKICFGLQGGGAYSETRSDTAFVDMNADGLPDFVIYDDAAEKIKVQYNQLGATNLLSTITNPTGQKIYLEFILSTPSKQHRQRKWNVEWITDEDEESPWEQRYYYDVEKAYNSPYYDNHERTDYGYESVTTEEAFMRRIEEKFYTDSYLERGRKKSDVLKNEHNKLFVGHRFYNTYKDPFNQAASPNCNNINLFSDLETVCTDYYDYWGTIKVTTRERTRFDKYHNAVEFFNDGDTAIVSDDWKRKVAYQPTTRYNLVSLPISDSIMTVNGTLLRLRYATWYNTGKLHQLKDVDAHSGTEAITSLFYNSFGNIYEYRLPHNANNERVNYSIQYESDLYALPSVISNQFNEKKYIYYNPKWGLPIRTVDPYGAEITYTYDYMGRLTHVLAPQERESYTQNNWLPNGSNIPYTIRYTYNNIYHNLADLQHDTLTYMYVLKQRATRFSQVPITEATIYTARGEQMQKKKRTEVYGQVVNLTDGFRDLDAFGNVIESYYPSTSKSQLWIYDDMSNSTGAGSTTIDYDILGRDTLITLPDGREIIKFYDFGTDCAGNKRFWEIAADPLGTVTSKYISPQGWVTEMKDDYGYGTCYDYNCIGELTQVTDADGYQTTYTYNGFGQQTERNHPDAGITRRRFDAAGNIICTKNQKQIDINDSTTYHYRFDRLMEVHHAAKHWENVSLNYDMAGRLALREDRTGYERLWYDEFGNVRQTHRRIIIPSDSTAFLFGTQYTYDSFGRIRQIVYPDGEIVNYSYHAAGGNVQGMQGSQIGVTNIYHDELEHITHKRYNNGCYTEYDYDTDRQWLESITTTSANDSYTTFQSLAYRHDYAGNITHISQKSPQWRNMGGIYTDEYTYDNHYRLAQNLHSDGYTSNTSYNMTYSNSSRIGSKSSTHPSLGYPNLLYGYDNSGLTHQPRVIHDNYSGQHLQLYWDRNGNLRQIQPADGYARFHMWDDDNQLMVSVGSTTCGYYGNASDGKRAYKLSGVYSISSVNGDVTDGTAYFDNTVLYPNQFMTLNQQHYTKHYFIGSERIGTTIGGGNDGHWLITPMFNNLNQAEQHLRYTLSDGYTYYHSYYAYYHNLNDNNHTINTNYTGSVNSGSNTFALYQYNDKEQHLGYLTFNFSGMFVDAMQEYCFNNRTDIPYYYHSDHLGSAAWITDAKGSPVQYLMYAPYGEQLLNQQSTTTYNERFTFTGKERDEETGYDYFGARNYLSALSIWGAVDPLADKYIYNSPYVYCDGNPIKYVDPDGRWSVSVHAFSNRAKSPYAIYRVHNRHGDVIFQTVVKCKGHKGAEFRDRRITYGDTPTGLYKQKSWKKADDSRFGVNPFIVQDYLEGEAKGPGTSNRNGMHTHGGGDILNEKGELVDLKGTSGCIRMADEDIKEMKSITDALQNLDPQENMTTLTVSNDLEKPIDNFSQSREEVKNDNGGFWLPEIEVTP